MIASILTHPNICSKSTIRKERNMFKVNNKDTRTTSLTSLWCFIMDWNIFYTFSAASIVYFKPVNVCLEKGEVLCSDKIKIKTSPKVLHFYVKFSQLHWKISKTSTSTSTSTTLGNIYANSTVILRPKLSTSCSEKKAWIPLVFQWAGSAAKYIVLTTKNI